MSPQRCSASGKSASVVVSYGSEAFTAGFLIGVHLRDESRLETALLALAVDAVQERGRHAVIADHCDLASVAQLETVYSDALVESMTVGEEEREALRSPVTRIFEAGLAVGLELGSGGDRELARSSPSRSSTRSSSSATGSKAAAGQTNMSSMSSRPSRWPCSQGSRDRVSIVCA